MNEESTKIGDDKLNIINWLVAQIIGTLVVEMLLLGIVYLTRDD